MIEQKGIEILVDRSIALKKILLCISNRIDDDTEEECFMKDGHFKIEKRKKHSGEIYECIAIDNDIAQGLMDSLITAGIRPRDEGSPGELKAVKYHLEDMRKIAFGEIKKSFKLEDQ